MRGFLCVVALMACGKSDSSSAHKQTPAKDAMPEVAVADAPRPSPVPADQMMAVIAQRLPVPPRFAVLNWQTPNLGLLLTIADMPEEKAKSLAMGIVKDEIDLLIRFGYNPRIEHCYVTLTLVVANESVTGATRDRPRWAAMYDPAKDEITWEQFRQ